VWGEGGEDWCVRAPGVPGAFVIEGFGWVNVRCPSTHLGGGPVRLARALRAVRGERGPRSGGGGALRSDQVSRGERGETAFRRVGRTGALGGGPLIIGCSRKRGGRRRGRSVSGPP